MGGFKDERMDGLSGWLTDKRMNDADLSNSAFKRLSLDVNLDIKVTFFCIYHSSTHETILQKKCAKITKIF